MRLGLSLALTSHGPSGAASSLTQTSAPSVTNNGTAVAKVGDVQAIASGAYTDTSGGSVSVATTLVLDGNIASNNYTLLRDEIGQILVARDTVTVTGGDNPGVYVFNVTVGAVSLYPWDLMLNDTERAVLIDDQVVALNQTIGQQVGTTVKIPPGATQAHVKITALGEITSTMRFFTNLSTSQAVGFNTVNDVVANPYAYIIHPGDDPDIWVTVDIVNPRSNPGDQFKIAFNGVGWDDPSGVIFEIENGAVNELPGVMPFHRLPRQWTKTGAAGLALDIPNIEITDTGFSGNAASGTPVWRSHLPFGYSNYNNGERGIYMDEYSYPNDAINPLTIEQDANGDDLLRLHTRRLPEQISLNGHLFPFQAAMIQGEGLDPWCNRLGVYRAVLTIPSRQHAWSAFWLTGRDASGSHVWPPEIDIGEFFNAENSFTPKTYSGAQHVGEHGSGILEKSGGFGSELDQIGFSSGLDLNVEKHEFVIEITDQWLTLFIDGVEIGQWTNMTGRADGSTDWDFYPILNVAVAKNNTDADNEPNPVYPYSDGVGDMLVYELEYYPEGANYTVSDYATPAPYPNGKVSPDPDFGPSIDDVSGLDLWLDADLAQNVKDSAGAVRAWAGRSKATNSAAQSVSSEQPITGTRTIGGLNALDFDPASSHKLAITTPLDRTAGSTVFAVVRFDNLGSNRPILGSQLDGMTLRSRNTGQLEVVKTARSVILASASGTVSTGTEYLLAFVSAPSGNKIFLNGGPVLASNTTDPGYLVNTDTVGGSGTEHMDGLIGEIAAYTGILSDADMDTVGNSLASKWGLAWTNIVTAPDNLILSGITLVGGSGENPPSLSVTHTYDGSEPIRLNGITSTSATAPTKADIVAGTGAGTLEEFSGVISGGNITLDNALTGASEPATYIWAYLVEDGGGVDESAIAGYGDGTSLGIDATAGTLSGVSDAAGDTTASVAWAVDTDNGTGYCVWVADGAPVPSADQIIAGTDGADAAAIATASQAVSAAGAQTAFSATGLTNGAVLDRYIVHRDDWSNESTVDAGTVTPVGGSALTYTYSGQQDSTEFFATGFTFSSLSLGTASANRHIVLSVAYVSTAGAGETVSATIGGVAATPVPASSVDGSGYGVALFYANVPTGATGDIVVTTGGTCYHVSIGWGWTDGTPTFGTASTATGFTDTYSFDANTTSGGYVFGVMCAADATGAAFTGITEQGSIVMSGTEEGLFLSSPVVTGETPRSMGATTDLFTNAGISVVPFS